MYDLLPSFSYSRSGIIGRKIRKGGRKGGEMRPLYFTAMLKVLQPRVGERGGGERGGRRRGQSSIYCSKGEKEGGRGGSSKTLAFNDSCRRGEEEEGKDYLLSLKRIRQN